MSFKSLKSAAAAAAGVIVSSLLVPGIAAAHTGVGATHGFSHGFLHPILGLDHLLAMVLVGVVAAGLGGRALPLVPAAFLAMMAVGGAVGIAGVDLPFVESVIAFSVVALGAAVAIGVRGPVAGAMAVVGAFALFHGQAHGAEMPADAGGLAYGAGFLLATALLHGAGLLAGRSLGRLGPLVLRLAGAASALVGVGLLAGAI